MTETKRVCFFHRADLDGKCSGAIVLQKYPDCKMVGINYGDNYEKTVFSVVDVDTEVYMVDFCLQPFDLMVGLKDSCKTLVWIDHHSEAIKLYDECGIVIPGIRIEGTAACALTWRYLFNSKAVPPAVEMLGLYDVWKWHGIVDCLEFQMGMRLENNWPDSPIWNRLLPVHDAEVYRVICDSGATVVRYQTNQNEIHARSASFGVRWKGFRWIAINEMFNNSNLFDSVWNPDIYDGMIAFGWRRDKWTVQLYSPEGGIDVGVIATSCGGGGHRHIAGFQCNVLPFMKF